MPAKDNKTVTIAGRDVKKAHLAGAGVGLVVVIFIIAMLATSFVTVKAGNIATNGAVDATCKLLVAGSSQFKFFGGSSN